MGSSDKRADTIALFDFDGTITTSDTFMQFLRFAAGERSFYWKLFLLSPSFLLYLFRIFDIATIKEKLLRSFFGKWNYSDFDRTAINFSKQINAKFVRKSALEKIKWHLSEQHKVVIVTASLANWIEPWASELGIDLVASEIEISKDNLITGKIVYHCNGQYKVDKLKRIYDLAIYREVYAYGDSKGDLQMLGLATKRFYKHFE